MKEAPAAIISKLREIDLKKIIRLWRTLELHSTKCVFPLHPLAFLIHESCDPCTDRF